MLELFQSKIFPIFALSACVIMFLAFGYSQCQLHKAAGEADALREDLCRKAEELQEKEEELQRKDQEIKYLQKGMASLEHYDNGKDKALEDERETKEGLLETVASDSGSKDWWDSQVPGNILDFLTCH